MNGVPDPANRHPQTNGVPDPSPSFPTDTVPARLSVGPATHFSRRFADHRFPHRLTLSLAHLYLSLSLSLSADRALPTSTADLRLYGQSLSLSLTQLPFSLANLPYTLSSFHFHLKSKISPNLSLYIPSPFKEIKFSHKILSFHP